MATQKAFVYVEKKVKPVIKDIPIPTPGDKQVLVKVTAAAINPVDYKIIDYGIFVDTFPAVLGTDIAGVVEKVGSEVTNFKEGDRVFYQGSFVSASNGFQHYATQDEDIVAKTPPNITDAEAATVPLCTMTAIVGLFHHTGLALHPPPPLEPSTRGTKNDGKSIFIPGGSSNVGQFAIQLARMANLSPIVTTASAGHRERLEKLGATHVLDRKSDKLVEEAREILDDDCQYAFDTIGDRSTQLLAMQVLSAKKPVYLATTLPPPEDKTGFPEKTEGSEWKGIIGSAYMHKDIGVPFYKVASDWLANGELKPNQPTVIHGLESIQQGLDDLKSGKVSAGKLVVDLSKTA